MTVIQFVKPESFACENAGLWITKDQDLYQTVGFCDWISMYQRHPGGNLKKFSDGAIAIIDKHGEVTGMRLKRERFEGSHDSAIMLKCDGEVVEFSGNVSKFNRQDNVFGLSFERCIEKINAILLGVGLPAFTAGDKFVSSRNGNAEILWSGAKLTRIDITENFAAGSKDDAAHFMRFLQAQQPARMKTGTFGDGETVDYGRGSRRAYFKVYVKGTELRRHNSGIGSSYVSRLADWCDEHGTVRAELTLHAMKLKDLGCTYLGGLNMAVIEAEFLDKCRVFTRAQGEISQLPEVPSQVLGTLRMWENGDNVAAKLKRATFYRHRLALLPFGIDIAIRAGVVRLQGRTRVIRLGPAVAPSFYQHEDSSYASYR